MNDDLDGLLKSARVPEPSPGYWEHFPKAVMSLLVGTDRRAVRVAATPRLARRSSPTIVWAAGLATACLLVGVGFWLKSKRRAETDYAKLYQEITALFPNQVRAIVVGETGVQLVLADKPTVPSDRPLLVNICEAKRCRQIITFSGQQVQVGDRKFEVLQDGHGHVLVVGDELAWSSAQPQRTERYNIEAGLL